METPDDFKLETVADTARPNKALKARTMVWKILFCLQNCKGGRELTTSQIAKLTNTETQKVYEACRALERAGYTEVSREKGKGVFTIKLTKKSKAFKQ